MTYLFVRHAVALERTEFSGNDLLRPLTEDGRDKARRAFKGLARFFSVPDVILTSQAVRAKETASLLAEAFEVEGPHETNLLNPGADYGNFVKLTEKWKDSSCIALVGHEPDLSEIVEELCGLSGLSLRKAGCAAVEMTLDGGQLSGVWPPRELRKIAGI